MQRRQSHPHGQLTGLIVIISMMLSVGIMFWLPTQHSQPLAQAADIATPELPITRTPRAERGPVANVAVPSPMPLPVDWSAIPTAVPAEQLIPPTAEPVIVQAQPEVVYITQAAPTPDNSALIAAQQALADAQAQAQAQADAMKAQADAALEAQRQEDARHAAELRDAQATAAPTTPQFITKYTPDRTLHHDQATRQP